MKEVSTRLLGLLATAIFFVVYGTTDTSQEFSCTEAGKFLIPESCQEYHYCKRLRIGIVYYRTSCHEGKIFDGVRGRCRWRVTSRPACTNAVAPPEAPLPEIAPTEVVLPEIFTTEAALSEIAATEAPLPNITEIPTTEAALPEIATAGAALPDVIPALDSFNNIQEIIPEIIKTSNELCPQIRAIENYVNELKSGIPIRIHYIRDVEHSESVTTYNTALENAQSEVNIWRNGNDLLADIKRTYDSVKKYEPDFDYKYRINAQQMKSISSSSSPSSQATISRLKDGIEQLKQDIQMIEEMSKETPSARRNLARKINNLRKKEQSLKEVSGHGREFDVLATFLEMVSKSARDVENKAKETESRMDEWHIILLIASSDLKSQSVKLDQVMEKLKDDTEAFEASIAKCQENIIEFNSQQSNLRSLMSKLEIKVVDNLKEITDAQAAILKKTLDHEREQRRICDIKGVPEEQFHDCTSILDPSCEMAANRCLLYKRIFSSPLDLTEDHAKVEQLLLVKSEQNQRLNNQMNNIMNQLTVIQKDIIQKEAYIEEYRGKIQQTKSGQADLSFYSEYQKKVLLAEDSALSAIEAVKSGLQEVDCAFHTIHDGLDGMVARARTARDLGEEHEEDVLKVKYSIDQHITELHQIIDQSSDNVSPLSCL